MWQNAIFEVSHSENRGKSSLNGNDEIVSGKLELSKIDISYLAIRIPRAEGCGRS